MARTGRWRLMTAGAVFLLAVGLPTVSPAGADIGDITTYDGPPGEVDEPTAMTVGPDGALWFTSFANDRIGRIDTATGTITTFEAGANIDGPSHITTGPDGNLWFTNANTARIGRLDPDTEVVSSFAHPALLDPRGITAGPDGNLWLTLASGCFGVVTPAGAVTVRYLSGEPCTNTTSNGLLGTIISAGGSLWYAYHRWIVRHDLTTGESRSWDDGYNDTYRTGGVSAITEAPDGSIWLARSYGTASCGGRAGFFRIDPATNQIASRGGTGCYTDYATSLTVRPDGSAWFPIAEYYSNRRAGRLNTFGEATFFGDSPTVNGAWPSEMVAGPDGALWFTMRDTDQIGRIDPEGPEVRIALSAPTSVGTGRNIDYTVTIRNTGTVTLTGLTTDAEWVPDCNRTLPDLAPGGTAALECTFTTTVGQSGYWHNKVAVDSDQTEPLLSNRVSTDVVVTPRVTIAQTVDDIGAVLGETIGYHLTIRNTGNIPLTGVAITDVAVPECAGPLADLPVGAEVVVDCEHVAAEADRGTLINIASVDTEQTTPVTSNSVDVEVGTVRAMSADLVADDDAVDIGTPIQYDLSVHNDGDVPLSGVSVDADLADCDEDLGIVLAGATEVVECALDTTRDELGIVTNAATVTADHLDPVAVGPVEVVVEIPSAGFTDVAGTAYFADAVDWAAYVSVMAGVGSIDTFRPSTTVTRKDVVKTLWRTMDRPVGAAPHQFSDVAASAPYRTAADWAYDTRVAGALPGNRFAPGRPVTRAQLIAMMWRMVGSPPGSPPTTLTDVPGNAGYRTAVDWADDMGLLEGFVPDDLLKPSRVVTRAQMADALYRLATTSEAWPQQSGDPDPPSTVLF